MYTVLQIAAYIANEYNKSHTEPIDEMRLHKYLYLSQRESFILHDKPLFEDTLRAWKFGPVCIEVRNAFHRGTLGNSLLKSYDSEFKELIEGVLRRYDSFSSWALSRLTHDETSWQNAREGIPDGVNGNNPMALLDIQTDAKNEQEYRGMTFIREVALFGRKDTL